MNIRVGNVIPEIIDFWETVRDAQHWLMLRHLSWCAQLEMHSGLIDFLHCQLPRGVLWHMNRPEALGLYGGIKIVPFADAREQYMCPSDGVTGTDEHGQLMYTLRWTSDLAETTFYTGLMQLRQMNLPPEVMNDRKRVLHIQQRATYTLVQTDQPEVGSFQVTTVGELSQKVEVTTRPTRAEAERHSQLHQALEARQRKATWTF